MVYSCKVCRCNNSIWVGMIEVTTHNGITYSIPSSIPVSPLSVCSVLLTGKHKHSPHNSRQNYNFSPNILSTPRPNHIGCAFLSCYESFFLQFCIFPSSLPPQGKRLCLLPSSLRRVKYCWIRLRVDQSLVYRLSWTATGKLCC